jgi:sec-independent protein translocase protein TatA
MGGLSVWHWLIFLAVALLLFGGSGKISSIMGDVAKGIKSFKKGLSEDEETAKKEEPPKVIETAAKPVESRPGEAAGADANKAGWSSKS